MENTVSFSVGVFVSGKKSDKVIILGNYIDFLYIMCYTV